MTDRVTPETLTDEHGMRMAVRGAVFDELMEIAKRQMKALVVIHVDSFQRIATDIAERAINARRGQP